jgi:hypothetical protein
MKNVVMSKLTEDTQYLLLRNYFRAVEQSLRNPALLRKSTYFEAFCEFFDDVTRLSRERHRNYKEESLTDILRVLRNIDLENLPTGGRTNISKSTILEVLKNTVSGHLDVREDMV